MKIILYSKDSNTAKAGIHKFSYQGTFLSECFITAKIESEEPVDFAIGDYLIFRGEMFVLNYIPPKQKQARKDSNGSAFVYDNIKFNSLADELTRVEFLDVVLSDNKIHYSSLSQFSFYANDVKDLANRIQANLDRAYSGTQKWTVTVAPDAVSFDREIKIDKQNCWEALTLAHSDFGLTFIVRNRTITIGTAGLAVGKVFGYGKGKGLYDIEQNTNADAKIITRLRAYGSTRNIPHRYYNGLKDSNGKPYIKESVYIPNLMLPSFPYTISDPAKVYIDAATMTEYGLREGSVYFDGSDGELPDIFPSLEGMTKKQLNDAGINVSLKNGDNGNIDECLGADNPSDNGVIPVDGNIPAEFTIYLKDLGFDLSAKDADGQYKYATTDTMQISMKNGYCIGRTFDIVENGIKKDTSPGYTRFVVECKRFTDNNTGGGVAFPNNQYRIAAGDKFVILGIDMPDVYVKAAAQRLKEAAKNYLVLHDSTKYTYAPKIDEIFMANNPELGEKIKEGDILNFDDTDLNIATSVIIQTLKIIVGDKLIPTYEVTLSNEQVAGTLDKIQNSINQLITNNTGITIEQVKSLILSLGTRHFLSRLKDDTAEGKINFIKDVSIEGNLTVHKKIQGKTEVISDQFGNDTFTSGQFGSGFRIWKSPVNGQSYAELDNLMVRRETIFNVLTIAEIRSVGGQILVSPANMVCSGVEETSDGYKCFFDTDKGTIGNQFAINDQAICRKFNGQDLKYYWRRVLSIGDDYIVLSKTDKDGSSIPAKGDDIIQFGNRTETSRQTAIMISAYGADAPSIKQYAGVNSYNLTGKEVTVISPSGNRFTGTFNVKSGTNVVRVPADRGTWQTGTPYYYYDRVSYNGALWLCVIPEGQATTSVPSESNTQWQKQVAEGKKGDTGQQGLQGVAGKDGKDGAVYYTWIRYADTAAGGGISNSPTGKLYIGFAYNKTTATESNNPADYKWSLIKGEKGDTGVEGAKGADGKTYYTWIKYSDNADGTGLYDTPKDSTKYIGIAVNKTTATESTNKTDYTWSLFKGADGKDGRDGINGTNGINGSSAYFHVRYSANANGNPMQTTPAKYIGTAVTQSMTAPTSYTAYTWYDWKGAQGTTGQQGIPGTSGTDGKTSYLHIKYSNDGGKTFTGNSGEDVGDWLGQYVDFVQADSNDVTKYQWSRLKGDKGDAGTLNYIEWKDVWKEGNTVPTGWTNNGTTAENIREYGLNPFGITSLLWKCVPNTDDNAAGGWGSPAVLLDQKYAYRYAVFVKKMRAGTTYHGCNNVYNLAGTVNSNPYFWNGTNLRAGEWFLMVGIIHPNHITANSGIGGVYEMSGKKFANGTDYKFYPTDTAVKFRSYLYYTSNPTDLQYFFNPMVHRLDGTEPSIEEILQLSTRKVVDAEFKILDDKIASKVSQTDFNSLQGRVSTTESKIEQQAGQISSTITKVEGKNAVYKSYTSATTDRPAVPYAKGDLWVTYDGVIKQSRNTRLTGAFTDADWVETTKYTDDTKANAAQTAATNAQNTANAKNRTYYSDTTPATPTGGNKVGDLWYKISLTDGCYLTYRWNGSTWQQINVYVSKSRIEQTDTRITSVVEKTGVNSLGNGETLYSKINQTASDIRLEVNKIQVGSRNYALKTSGVYPAAITLTNIQNQTIFPFTVKADNWKAGDTVTVSFDYKYSNLKKGNTSSKINIQGSGNITAWTNGFGGYAFTDKLNFATGTGEAKITYSFVLSAAQMQNTSFNTSIRHDYLTGTVAIKNFMVEKSTKPSDWSPAPEDIGQIAGSSLTLTDNKITLGAKTIELKGHTIAKAIQAEDLNVQTADGSSIFQVQNNGRFYSKSVSGQQSLEIDSQNRKIEFKNTQNVYTETNGMKSVTQTTKIDATSGMFESRDTDANVANISSQGIFANRAGVSPYSAATGINLKASIAGLGFGAMNKSYFSNWGLVGVFGRASNSNTSNPAPAYGGWFDILKVNGLVLRVRRISASTTLSQSDVYVSCYNTSEINLYMPANPYEGTVIFVRRVNSPNIRIYGNGKQIHVDGNVHNDVWHKGGRGDTSIFIYDGQYWMFNYWVR